MMDLHTHTIYSDGIGMVRDNVAWAEKRGLKIVGISDHIHYFTPSKFSAYINEIRIAKEESDIVVLAGIEANILENGPDITDEFRKRLDYVIASVHEWFGRDGAHMYIEYVKRAIMDDNVDIIGHFGNSFPWIGYPTEEEIREVLELAEAYGKAFEISSRYKVPDLEFIKECIRRGIKLSLATDAHRPEDVGKISWSLKMFEKAGGSKEDLVFSEYL
ncbi:PHP domain-containing protein [Pyrococcus abyssi]|uniref:Phosphotransferase, php family n=2 Tax=Pyrococcus abyssi (strain GE5 / Orsay) TaxID=272844 RepID=Q9V0F9_PYRAB|nr:PHP domain-containing protein [Pyrococcus abyssi]CAB49744.1 Putative phosphotransferase, php family [Pyrococcus abyssi GE5]